MPLILRGDPAALARPGVAVTSAPLVVMFFVLVGLRALFAIPIEPKANWIFRLREPANRLAVVAGVRRALIVGVRPAGHARRGRCPSASRGARASASRTRSSAR